MSAERNSKVAFLGTGIMGAPMAGHIARAGFPVTAWNRTPEKAEALKTRGVSLAKTAAEACAGADFVVVMLSTGPVVDDVLFSATTGRRSPVETAADDAIFIVMSSIPVPMARAQARRLRALGKHYIDAPVSGGQPGAIAGTLTVMAGGEENIVERTRPVLETMGRLTRVGDVGCGQLAKLANQAIVGITIGAVAEAFLVAEAGGVDLEALLTALKGGFADSTVLRKHGHNMARREFKPGAYAHIQLKDLVTAEEEAQAEGLNLVILPVVRELYAGMCTHGRSELDHSGLYLELAERAKRHKSG